MLETPPDIVLLDINLKGSLNSIQTTHALHEIADIPLSTSRPTPTKNIDLQRAIERPFIICWAVFRLPSIIIIELILFIEKV